MDIKNKIKDALKEVSKNYYNMESETRVRMRNFYIQGSIAMALYHALGRPSLLMGFIPIEEVQYIEHAISQDTLKYRSIGSQFLAHQEGSNEGFRFDAFIRPKDIWILSYIHLLYIIGGNVTSMIKGSVPKPNPGNFYYITKNNIFGEDIRDWNKVSSTDFEWTRYNGHTTFPIVTETDVLTNMYIESFHYWWQPTELGKEVVDGPDKGKNVCRLTVLFRRFDEPYEVEVSNILTNDVKLEKIGKKYRGRTLYNNNPNATIAKHKYNVGTYAKSKIPKNKQFDYQSHTLGLSFMHTVLNHITKKNKYKNYTNQDVYSNKIGGKFEEMIDL